MQSRFFLDVVVSEIATIREMLSGENQTLLIWRNTFLILDLGLHVVDRVRGLHIQGDRLSGQSLHLGGAQGPEEMKIEFAGFNASPVGNALFRIPASGVDVR